MPSAHVSSTQYVYDSVYLIVDNSFNVRFLNKRTNFSYRISIKIN
jgi:hypothetical protein